MSIKLLSPKWDNLLHSEFDKAYYKELQDHVNIAYKSHTIYPPAKQVFHALQLCAFDDTKVVIIGQDPYHGPNQAHGLSFSVTNDVRTPPSLKNIFKELKTDIPGFEIPTSGNLENWAKQGVLLLNAVLTVQAGLPGSHKNFGWQHFTDAIIKLVSEKKQHVVFLLWGAYAAAKAEFIDKDKHLILIAAHPSPLARGAFFGCKHFSKTNTYLVENNLLPVNWKLA